MAEVKSGAASNSGKVVWVGCKLPHGLILELFEPEPPLPENGIINPMNLRLRPRTRAKVTLRGANSVRNDMTLRGLSQLQYPFGITSVDAAFWEEWSRLHADYTPLVRGLIFVVDREKLFPAAARERADETTALEPLNPIAENDPRINKGRNLRREQRVEADREHLDRLNRMNAGDPPGVK